MSLGGFSKEDGRNILNLSKMMIRDRYIGSSMGIFWAVIHPLVLLGIYTFVFGFVLKPKVPGAETTLDYAIWFIGGFIVYLSISEGMGNSAASVLAGSSLVKNIPMKTEMIPMASVLTSMVSLAVGIVFMTLLLILTGRFPTWHILLVPIVLLLHWLFLAGLGFFLSALTVFVRDVAQILPTVNLLIIFSTPILYPLETLPQFFRWVTYFNPFYWMSQVYRDLLLFHRLPNGMGFLYWSLSSVVLFVLGLKFFRKLKGYFEMVL